MALTHGSISGTSAVRLGFSTSVPPSRASLVVPVVKVLRNSCRRRILREMVQEAVQGSPFVYAREMERLSAKESLLLALKDAGGFEALVTWKTTNMQRNDVNERIQMLLDPHPRNLQDTVSQLTTMNSALRKLSRTEDGSHIFEVMTAP